MRITTARKISQAFFFALFIWLCIVTAVGVKFWQLRGWPVNIFLHLDPLVAIGTVISTHKLLAPLLWSLATIILTILIGRFFCGWVCPFGTLHQFISLLSHRKKTAELLSVHKYHKAQNIKYYVLIVFLLMAALPGMRNLQSGLLDPIPMFTRTVNILLLPVIDNWTNVISAGQRFYKAVIPVLAVFLAFTILNFYIPRFFCLFICPLGALFGILNQFVIFRINRNSKCTNCKLCNAHCQGNCQPSETVKLSECLLCMNCIDDCKFDAVDFSTASNPNVQTPPDITRRGLMAAAFTGLMAMPTFKLLKTSRDSVGIIRPPGALPENEFIKRCIKCGQCMRLCPTNVIQPLGIEAGVLNLWTSTMNYRIGTSGCQYDCVACGYVCPTGAIRPLTLAEKLGKGKFSADGPIKLGTASFDRTKCLPWAFSTPCLVCQENCPVSPKAIYTHESFSSVFDTDKIKSVQDGEIVLGENSLEADKFAAGDYYCQFNANGKVAREPIIANSSNTIKIAQNISDAAVNNIQIMLRLQRPFVDSSKCIGCGICQHECPVSGKGAVIVTPYGQSREK
ncbi:MAG: 4Fe-4S binding protein [Planctomycetaceae bacterium]|nr:4Fe-4S binding protein [Planctomycetaceae bacterium]